MNWDLFFHISACFIGVALFIFIAYITIKSIINNIKLKNYWGLIIVIIMSVYIYPQIWPINAIYEIKDWVLTLI